MTIPKFASAALDPAERIDLSTALQYGTAEGYPPLRSFLRQFTRSNLHPNVPYLDGPEIILTCGSTDGFSKVAELIVDPWREGVDDVRDRPGMLCEAFVYMVPATTVRPKGVQVVPVEMDAGGMKASGPGGLEDVLENWDPSKGRRPHFMYTVTMGQNPTGSVLAIERRRQLYAICQKYDVLIVEDDPYWYIQFASAAAAEAKSRGLPVPEMTRRASALGKSSGYDYIDSLEPSYLSIDTDGRVIRLDSFSKTVAPGCRLGWITTQPAFIERLERITECSTQQPSGFVQSTIAELIMGAQPSVAKSAFRALTSPRERLHFAGWRTDGWVRWLEGLRGNYERRMQTMCTILDEHAYQLKQSTPARGGDADWGVITKTRLYSFDWPRGGMFVWLRMHFESHPLWQAKGDRLPVLNGSALSLALTMFCTHKPHLIIPGPGGMFASSETIMAERGWAHIRLCYAAVSDADVEACTQRFANAVQRFWRIKDVDVIERCIAELEGARASEYDLEQDGQVVVNMGSMPAGYY
jgi:DNA-binding transcriptional MocR family regulator